MSAKLAITDNADGTLTIDPAQTWLWRGVFRYSSDDFLLADRTVPTVASKTYHLRWHAPGTGTAIPEATYPNGRFELADLTGANPAEGDVSYDTTYDRMLIARIVTDVGNIATITVLKNLAVLSEEIRWAVMTKSEVTAPLYYEGFSYGVVVPARTSNSWGGVMILPPAPLALNWSRSPSAAWQVGFFTGNTINNDPPVVADKDGETLTDGSGSTTVINNRYQQYPVARADSNTGNLIFDSFMAQFKGVLNA